MKDSELIKSVLSIQKKIAALASKYRYNDFKFWNYLDYHEQEPEEEESCATVLTCDSGMLESLNGFRDDDFADEFYELLQHENFFYEHQTSSVIHIHSDDDFVSDKFRDLLQWNWITYLIKPEFSDLHDELFAYFDKTRKSFTP